jgi:hypothetical protein
MKWLFNPCRRYRQGICLLAGGALASSASDEVKNHLAACRDCRNCYEEMKAVTTPLANWQQDLAHLQPTQAARNRWAKAVQAAGGPEPVRRPTPAVAFCEWWQAVIWSSRRVWAGLAVVWVLILMGNLSLRDHSQVIAAKSPPPSQEMIMALKDRQNILAELLADHFGLHDADRQKFFLPKPRTERVIVFTM